MVQREKATHQQDSPENISGLKTSTFADPPVPRRGSWRNDGRSAADVPGHLDVSRVCVVRAGRALQEQAVRHLQEVPRPGIHVRDR